MPLGRGLHVHERLRPTFGEQGTLDQLTAIYDGGLRSQGLRSGAALDRSEAKSTRKAGWLSAGTGFLNSYANGYLE
jgi:hypothetical protein